MVKVEGKVDGVKQVMILDPAAAISLVPKEIVSRRKWNGRRSIIAALHGPNMERDIAVVEIKVLGKMLTKQVAFCC